MSGFDNSQERHQKIKEAMESKEARALWFEFLKGMHDIHNCISRCKSEKIEFKDGEEFGIPDPIFAIVGGLHTAVLFENLVCRSFCDDFGRSFPKGMEEIQAVCKCGWRSTIYKLYFEGRSPEMEDFEAHKLVCPIHINKSNQ